MSERAIIQSSNRVAIADEPPERFQIMPWGRFVAQAAAGGELAALVDEQAFGEIAASHKALNRDVAIDFNHQSADPEFERSGKPPLILGYIAGFEMVPGDGVYATGVTWTPPGAELVRNRQVRYPSFVGDIRLSDNRVLSVDSVGLVTDPYIGGIRPVVNRNRGHEGQKENSMNEIKKALALADGATEAECVTAINKRKTDAEKGDTFRASIAKTLNLKGDENDDTIVASVNALKDKAEKQPAGADPDPTKFVPMSEFTKLREESARTSASLLAINRKAFIDRGLAEGRLCSANREAWEKRYDANPADTEEAVKLIPEGTYPADGVVATKNAAGTAPTGGSDRVSVINRAKAEFKGSTDLQRMTTAQAHVIGELITAGHSGALSDEEKKTVAA